MRQKNLFDIVFMFSTFLIMTLQQYTQLPHITIDIHLLDEPCAWTRFATCVNRKRRENSSKPPNLNSNDSNQSLCLRYTLEQYLCVE
ncbi:MAG: hypothetical protein JOS17DRAFT_205005 [Linnemannia elongata]|nr:MAG: hypothetical protein JOS17DRAFT_205005 [Linnemannia elongata]